MFSKIWFLAAMLKYKMSESKKTYANILLSCFLLFAIWRHQIKLRREVLEMCLKLMLCVTIKLFQLAFPIKRKRLTLTPCLLPKETLQFKSWICLFCDQIKYPYSLCEEVFVYLTQGYESIWNKIDHLCLLRIFFYRWSDVLKLY